MKLHAATYTYLRWIGGLTIVSLLVNFTPLSGDTPGSPQVVTSATKYRMLYAPSRELVDYAVNMGMNWVVVA